MLYQTDAFLFTFAYLLQVKGLERHHGLTDALGSAGQWHVPMFIFTFSTGFCLRTPDPTDAPGCVGHIPVHLRVPRALADLLVAGAGLVLPGLHLLRLHIPHHYR